MLWGYYTLLLLTILLRHPERLVLPFFENATIGAQNFRRFLLRQKGSVIDNTTQS